MTNKTDEQRAFSQEVAQRFGLVPNFFVSARDAPDVTAKLWEFAKAAYLDTPIPSLFKERLFVYLSRFCAVRYCITRHCAFLLGYGHAAGDPAARAQTVAQAIRLLKTLPPWRREFDVVLDGLESEPMPGSWPEPDSQLEDWIFAAATVVFVEPARSERARRALRQALGGERFEMLMGLLAFIRTVHYWTLLHPEIEFEDDVQAMLRLDEELARLLLDDPEAARCDMGVRLFAELEELRDLNERRELERANRELERRARQQEMLLKEVNHRVKNSLQIVSSVLHLQTTLVEGPAADALHSAAARVQAIAAVHERLYQDDDVHTVALEPFLRGLCDEIGRAFACSEGILVDAPGVEVPTDFAVPLALIVNELVTNAIKHVGPPCRIILQADPAGPLKLTVADTGSGPPSPSHPRGLGSRIIDAYARQLGATLETKRGDEGYTVTLSVPLAKKAATDECVDRRGRGADRHAP